MIYKYRDNDFIRKGYIEINGKKRETPISWDVCSTYEDLEFQLDLFEKNNIKTLFTNAFYFIQKKYKVKTLKERAREFLHMMDSGGYQIFGGNKMGLEQEEIFKKQIESEKKDQKKKPRKH
jgi:queuine/archaeosine tRNA-ribosyltransferase